MLNKYDSFAEEKEKVSMTVIRKVEFMPFNEDATVRPKAGRSYLVVLKSSGAFMSIQTAQYIHHYFSDIDLMYLGFAQFQGTELERNRIEVYGLSSKKFKLLGNVLGWAKLPIVKANELLID